MAIATQFLTGFEHGFVGSAAAAGGGLFDVVTGTGFSASTTSPRNGAYCAHCVAPASTITRVGKTISGSKLIIRFAVKLSSRPTANCRIAHCTNSVAATTFSIESSSIGGLSVVSGGATRTGPIIDTTNWHLIELQIDTTANIVDWKVDGVSMNQVSGGSAMGTLTTFYLGTDLASGSAFTADYDDLIVGTWTTAATDWYGDGKILGQLAGSDGTHATITSLSPGDAGTAYSGTVTTANTMVDDPPATSGWSATRSATDNLALRVATVGAYAEIKPATTSEIGLASAVRAIMSYSSSTTQANLAACDVRNSAGAVTELWGLTGGVGKAYNIVANQFKGGIVTVPAAGWSAAEVNLIRVRFGGCTAADISPVPTVQAMMLEVDWPVFPVAASPPVDETSIDDFNRADGPIYAGAGASIWESVGKVDDNTTASVIVTASNQLGTTSLGYVRSKVQLQSNFDLLFDVVLGASSSVLRCFFALTDVGTTGYDGYSLAVNGNAWTLSYYTDGSPTTLISTSAGPSVISGGGTIWIAKRGTKTSIYYRDSVAASYQQILTIDDSRNNVASPFTFTVPNNVWRLDNLRGGPLVATGTTYNDTGSGTVAVSGTATESRTNTDSRSGTVTLSGILARPISTLTDDFTTLDTTKWEILYTPPAFVSSGQLHIPRSFDYSTVRANTLYDLVGSEVRLEVIQANVTITDAETNIYLYGINTVRDMITMDVYVWASGDTRLDMYYRANGVTESSLPYIPYDPVQHRWWRIREQSGSIYWDTSPDGSNWTNRRVATWPLASTVIRPTITAGYSSAAATDDAIFDNFNFLAFADSGSGTIIASGTSTEVYSPGTGGITYTDVGSVTITSSGIGVESQLYTDTSTGTMAVTGTDVETDVYTDTGIGTVAITGTRVETDVYTDTGIGTTIVTGTSVESQIYTNSTSGTTLVSGTSSESIVFADARTDIIVVSGTGIESYTSGPTYTDAASGTVATQGTSTETYFGTDTVVGTGIVSGTGTDVFSASDVNTGTCVVLGIGTDSAVHTSSGTGSTNASGIGVDAWSYTDTSSGTIAITGTGTDARVYPDTGTGTIVIAGTGTDSYIYTDVSTVTVAVIGTGTDTAAYADSGISTEVATGTSTESVVYTASATGTTIVSGVSSETTVHNASAVGTSVVSGTGIDNEVYVDTASGTTLVSGTGSDSFASLIGYIDARTGQITISGTSADSQSHASTPIGSVLVNGTGVESQTHTSAASGSMLVDGTSSEFLSYTNAATGSLLVTGVGVESQSHTSTVSESLIVNGTGIESQSHTSTAIGSLLADGSSAESQSHTSTTTGLVLVIGTGVESQIHEIIYTDISEGNVTSTGTGIDSFSYTDTVIGTITNTGTGFDSVSYSNTVTGVATLLDTGSVENYEYTDASTDFIVLTGTARDSYTQAVQPTPISKVVALNRIHVMVQNKAPIRSMVTSTAPIRVQIVLQSSIKVEATKPTGMKVLVANR